jgi:hypothetical protein
MTDYSSSSNFTKVRYKDRDIVYILKDDDVYDSGENIQWEKQMKFMDSDDDSYLISDRTDFIIPHFEIFAACKKENCGLIDGEYIDCEDCDYVMTIRDIKDKSAERMEDLQKIYEVCSEKQLCLEWKDTWIAKDKKKLVIITKKYNERLFELLIFEERHYQKNNIFFQALYLIHQLHSSLILLNKINTHTFVTDEFDRIKIFNIDDATFLKKHDGWEDRAFELFKKDIKELMDYVNIDSFNHSITGIFMSQSRKFESIPKNIENALQFEREFLKKNGRLYE